MPGPPTTEESHQIEALTQAVEELRRRVAALEQWSTSTSAGVTVAPPITPALLPPAELPDVSPGILSALGRVLLGIAGAYLLRAITEAGLVPQRAGTSLGLLYAAGWLLSSARISTGRRLTVAMHGVTAACIVAPLLWEATLRFHSVPPAAAASVLALFVILGQVLAWQRDHSELAGVTAFTGSATALTLIVATLNPLPFAVALTLVAAVVEYGAWHGHALSWRWIAALACDFCGFLLLYLVTRPQGLPEGYAAIPVAAVSVLLTALAGIYVTSTALRTLVRGTAMTWFEVLQIALAAALAIGGGRLISHDAGPWPVLIAAACLILGAACYLAAFTSLASGRNFHAYASFALLLVLIGGALLPAGAALLWTGLALAAAAFSMAGQAETPAMHAAIYVHAAASASGLLIYAAGALTASAAHRAGTLNAAALLCVLAAGAVYGLVLRSRKRAAVAWPQRIPAALVAALLAWTLAGLACGVLLRLPVEAPLASTVRTGVLSAFAIALAWFGSRRGWRELIWILFPWMLFGAIKLVAEDFQHGRSDTLFLSLLIYGGTLIALPRLLRRESRPT